MSYNKKNYGLNILIIEDDHVSRYLLEQLCKMYSCSADSAKTGEDAILKTKSNNYDLVFMDIQLLSSNGMDIMDTIRGTSKFYEKIPFVPYTANIFPEDLELYNSRGMIHLLPKPFDLTLLEEILDDVNSVKINEDRQLKFFD